MQSPHQTGRQNDLKNAIESRMTNPVSNRSAAFATIARLTLAPIFIVIGIVHLARPEIFVPMMPASVPMPRLVIVLTGVAEMADPVGLFFLPVRKLASIMLVIYAVCVYPVNINHAVHDLSTGTGAGMLYHYPRLFAQPLIWLWTLIAGGWFAKVERWIDRTSSAIEIGFLKDRNGSFGFHQYEWD